MKYNELHLKKNRTKARVGRGISAGGGKTAGRGTKGQGSRKSGGVRPGFEGGQMPLYMRLPKLRGFNSHRNPPETIYTGQLANIKKTTISANDLAEKGLISSPHANVKLIVKGQLTDKKQVRLTAASQNAIEMMKKAGGEYIKVDRQPRVKANPEA